MDPLLQVNSTGLAEGATGSIIGDTATFKTSCVNAPVLLNAMEPPAPGEEQWRTCDTIIRIDAKPDAKVLFMTIDFEINEDVFTHAAMTPHRVDKASP
jgi:hypothetical protein